MEGTSKTVKSYAGELVGLSFVPLLLFFTLLSGGRLRAQAVETLSVFSPQTRQNVMYFIDVFMGQVTAFFRGQLFIEDHGEPFGAGPCTGGDLGILLGYRTRGSDRQILAVPLTAFVVAVWRQAKAGLTRSMPWDHDADRIETVNGARVAGSDGPADRRWVR